MVNYIEIGNRSVMKQGTSLSLTIPNEYVVKNGIEKGDKLSVKWDGGSRLLLVAEKKEE